MKRRPKRLWVVQGFDSLEEIYRAEFPLSRYSAKSMEELLRFLYARVALTEREIAEALGRGRSGLLEVHRSFADPHWTCGNNPHFTARIVDNT